jgi:hypothetical protein
MLGSNATKVFACYAHRDGAELAERRICGFYV